MALADRAIAQLDRARRIRTAHGIPAESRSTQQLDRARSNLVSFRAGRQG